MSADRPTHSLRREIRRGVLALTLGLGVEAVLLLPRLTWENPAFLYGLLAWCVAPFVLSAAWLGHQRWHGYTSRWPIASAALIAATGVAALVDAFFWHVDAQSGLVLLFLPAVQMAMVAVPATGLLLVVLHRRLSR